MSIKKYEVITLQDEQGRISSFSYSFDNLEDANLLAKRSNNNYTKVIIIDTEKKYHVRKQGYSIIPHLNGTSQILYKNINTNGAIFFSSINEDKEFSCGIEEFFQICSNN